MVFSKENSVDLDTEGPVLLRRNGDAVGFETSSMGITGLKKSSQRDCEDDKSFITLSQLLPRNGTLLSYNELVSFPK